MPISKRLILTFCLTLAHGCGLFAAAVAAAVVVAQNTQADKNNQTNKNNQIDKIARARFEKSIEAGKTEEIESSLLALAVANPNNPQVLELLAKLRYRQNRLSEALALYKRITTLDPHSTTAKINTASILYAFGQTENARQMLDAVAETPIPDPTLQLDLAAAFLSIGEPQKALNQTEKLSLKIKNTLALPVLAASFAALKMDAKLRELLPLMKKASPLNPVLAAQCAEVLASASMQAEAVNLLRSTLATSPNNFENLILLGKLEVATGELAFAKQHLTRAARLQPRSAKVLSARALLEEAAGNQAAALDFLAQAREINPDSPELLKQFIVTAMRAGQASAAVEAAQMLVKTQPAEPENLYLLGAALLQNNNTVEAQTNLQRFVELRPRDSRGCLALGLTFAAQASDQIENARRQLTRCTEIDPRNYEAFYQLGLSYKAQGETAKAVQYMEETIQLAPNYPLALRDLGALYLQTGAEQKARAVLEKAFALAPDDADTNFQLSRLYNLTGETARAKKHLEAFQKLKNQ